MSGINQNSVASILVLLLMTLFVPTQSIAAENTAKNVGKTLLALGKVISKRKGVDVPLKRRSAIFEKDEIHVGSGGRAQIRMIDKAIISLQENSVLQINSYRYEKGSKNNSAFLELLSGGLRTITGAIGKGNKKAYELRTPLATIGIRGTDYEVEIVPNGMYVAVWDGVIHLRARLKNGCNMLIGRSQPFMFIFIDRLGKCKGLTQVPDVFSTGHSSNIPPKKQLKRKFVKREFSRIGAPALAKGLVIEPQIQVPPQPPATILPPVVPPVIPIVPVQPPIQPPIKPPVQPVTYDHYAFNVDQSRPSQELDAKSSLINSNDPTFKVGLDLYNNASAVTVTDFQQSIGGLPVSWGYWGQFSTSAAAKNTSSLTTNGMIWATYEPTDPAIVSARTGSFSRFDTITDSLLSSSAGGVNNLQVQMDVNFESGSVTNGALSANTSNETWVAVFDGNIIAGDLSLELNGVSVIDSNPGTPSPARDANGYIAGDFVGNKADAILGAFGFSENNSSSNHIEGVFIVK